MNNYGYPDSLSLLIGKRETKETVTQQTNNNFKKMKKDVRDSSPCHDWGGGSNIYLEINMKHL